nr:uncharacterized protein LOC115269233 [Aedes albopictus]
MLRIARTSPDRRSATRDAQCVQFFAIGDVQQEEWYFDSGATTHMARVGTGFEDKQELAFQIGTANNGTMRSQARGTVNLDCVEGDVALQEVLEVPDLAANLLSVSKICAKGFEVLFTKQGCQVLTQDGEVFASGIAERGLYRLNRREVNRAEFGAQKDPVEFIEIEFPEWIEEAPVVRVPDRRLDEPEVASGGSISGGATAPAEPSEGSSSDTDFEDADDNDAIALPPQSLSLQHV